MPSPGEDVQAWSTTASANANSDPLINWAEGQPRASVNNSARSQMAAHAKKRNLENGSITTGGTANAQTFTSGLTYTAVPTGLWVRLKAGVTNTGATTLNMDGIADVAVKDQLGNDLTPGALTLGRYVELLYNGTNWILLSLQPSAAAPQCGRLTGVTSNLLSFKPYNGDVIKIAGITHTIPPAGIAGLGITGVYVNGVAGQNVPDGPHLVSCFNNGGVLTGNYTALATGHSTSTTPGNVGVEIIAGNEANTLIGMVYVNSGQFWDAINERFIISWFNRRNIAVQGIATTNWTAGTLTELNSSCRALYLTWGDEDVLVGLSGYSTSVSPSHSFVALALDNVTQAFPTNSIQSTVSSESYFAAHTGVCSVRQTEGSHFISPYAGTAGSTNTFYLWANGIIRG